MNLRQSVESKGPTEAGIETLKRYIYGDTAPDVAAHVETYYPGHSITDLLRLINPYNSTAINSKPIPRIAPCESNRDVHRYLAGDTSPYVEEAVRGLYPGLNNEQILVSVYGVKREIGKALSGFQGLTAATATLPTHPPKSNRELLLNDFPGGFTTGE